MPSGRRERAAPRDLAPGRGTQHGGRGGGAARATRARRVGQSLSARLLQGAPIAAEIRASVKDDVEAFQRRHGFTPALAVVIVGRDAPSMVYLELILRGCAKVGIAGQLVEMPGRA